MATKYWPQLQECLKNLPQISNNNQILFPVNHENEVSCRKAILKHIFNLKAKCLHLGGFVILSLYAVLSVISSIIYIPYIHIPAFFMPNRPVKESSNIAYIQPSRSILYIFCQGDLYSFPLRRSKGSHFSESTPKVQNIQHNEIQHTKRFNK